MATGAAIPSERHDAGRLGVDSDEPSKTTKDSAFGGAVYSTISGSVTNIIGMTDLLIKCFTLLLFGEVGGVHQSNDLTNEDVCFGTPFGLIKELISLAVKLCRVHWFFDFHWSTPVPLCGGW